MDEVIAFTLGKNPMDYVVDHAPDKTYWSCMDDRPVGPSSSVLTGRLYRQHGGGAYGFGQDAAVTMEAARAGSVTGEGVERPVHVLGNVIAQLAGREMQALMNHDPCAALLGSVAIAQTIVDNPEAVWNSTLPFKPDITSDEFERYMHAHHRLLNHNIYVDPQEALAEMAATRNKLPAVPVATLVDKPHAAVAFVANFHSKKALHVPEANQAGVPVYYESFGDFPEIVRATKNTLPLIRVEPLQTAAAIRLGAIRAKHLLGPDERPLPVLRAA